MPNDMIPEENEELYKKLIPLLQHGFHDPVTISSPESSQIIAQVRERLMQAEYLSPVDENAPVQQPGQITTSNPLPGVRSLKSRIPRFINVLAAVLVVGILISTSLLLFHPRPYSPAAIPTAASTGPSAHTQFNGFEASIHLVTPGPYFLSELLLVDVSLTNHTQKSLTLDGRDKTADQCVYSAINARLTGKSASSYAFPELDVVCTAVGYFTDLKPDHTLSIRQYLPVTNSGEVTITMATTRYQTSDPLNGHWPSLHIHVTPQIPSDHIISLGTQGTRVMIQAPQAVRTHLLYMQSISCDNNVGGGSLSWVPLKTTVLFQPACPTAHKHWKYIVSAPGYPIVSGSLPSSTSSAKNT